ncbi:MAG: EamA family transporter [Legionella sp.]|nr:EamA family transporter [Legionella sp.]
MIKNQNHTGTYILLLLAAFFGGASFIITKMVVKDMPPLTAAAIRYSLASIIIMSFVFIQDRHTLIQQISKNWKIFIGLGILGIAGFNSLLFIGLMSSSAVNASIIMATNPLVTLLLSAWIIGDSINLKQKLGALLSLYGVLIVITHGMLANLFKLNISKGDIFLIIANLCWGFYCVFARRYIKKTDPMISVGATMCTGAIMLILLASLREGRMNWSMLTWQLSAALCFLSFFGSVLVYFFWNIGFKNVGVGTTSAFFNFIPVFTVLLSELISIPVDGPQLVGSIVIFSGVIISIIKSRNKWDKLAEPT